MVDLVERRESDGVGFGRFEDFAELGMSDTSDVDAAMGTGVGGGVDEGGRVGRSDG